LKTLDISEILDLLPHRYPFLLIDKVLDFEPFDYIQAVKNVTINEPFFQGHFPGMPIMPGVLMLEALAQAGGLLFSKSRTPEPGHEFVYFFAGIDKVKFKQIVVPGDQLNIDIKLLVKKREFWRMQGTVHVGDKLACSAEILSAVKEVKK
jgi:3-hydroxyacyl-[acyl-carrier-protein] dehydratase